MDAVLLLLLLALVCFIASAARLVVPRLDLVATGLALVTLYFLISRGLLT